MSDKAWYESFFGEDYFDIYDLTLSPERTASEVEGIVSLLEINPGNRILDLACGHGRHSIPLSKQGFDVTGFDLSEVFLERARSEAKATDVQVRWVQGDMRSLSFKEAFDGVINVFTAFGYFEDPADDLATLQGVRAALKPGGRFLLETLYRDGLPARFQTLQYQETKGGTIVLHDHQWNLATDVMHDDVTLIRPDGSRVHYTTEVRMRTLREHLQLFREAGLEPIAWYGGLDGSDLTLRSPRLAIVAERGS